MDREKSAEKRKKKKRLRRKRSNSTSSSEEEETRKKKVKRSRSKQQKRRRSPSSSSSSSSSSSTSSSSSSISSSSDDKKKQRKRKKDHEQNESETCDIPLDLMDKSKAMAPMTKEQWEKQQSSVRRVYDESTGRWRLIKGTGEVIEEIVSRDRHKLINQQATRGDGEFFQANLLANQK